MAELHWTENPEKPVENELHGICSLSTTSLLSPGFQRATRDLERNWKQQPKTVRGEWTPAVAKGIEIIEYCDTKNVIDGGITKRLV